MWRLSRKDKGRVRLGKEDKGIRVGGRREDGEWDRW
jgi:hypothetical protein